MPVAYTCSCHAYYLRPMLAQRSHLSRDALCAAADFADCITVLTRRLVCAAAGPRLHPLRLLHIPGSCSVVVGYLGWTLWALQCPAVKCNNMNLRSGRCGKQLVASGAVIPLTQVTKVPAMSQLNRFDTNNCLHHTMLINAAACHTLGMQQLRAAWAWPLLLQVRQRCCCHLPLGGRIISLLWVAACACNAPANSKSGFLKSAFARGLGTCTAFGKHIFMSSGLLAHDSGVLPCCVLSQSHIWGEFK
jgi:hypothetical protein